MYCYNACSFLLSKWCISFLSNGLGLVAGRGGSSLALFASFLPLSALPFPICIGGWDRAGLRNMEAVRGHYCTSHHYHTCVNNRRTRGVRLAGACAVAHSAAAAAAAFYDARVGGGAANTAFWCELHLFMWMFTYTSPGSIWSHIIPVLMLVW